MTVAELIEQLQGEDPKTEVYFVYNYGDHCRTMAAVSPKNVELREVQKDEYIQGMSVVEDDRYRNDDAKTVVILEG